MHDYQFWIALERILTSIMIIGILFKTKTLDSRKKYGIYVVLLYILATVVFSLMQSQIWYCLYFVLDIMMVLYMTNKSKKAVYCVIVFDTLLELLSYIFMYCWIFVYQIPRSVFQLGPECISFAVFLILYYLLGNKNNIDNQLNFTFNTAFLLIWIILTKNTFEFMMYDYGMINYVLLIIVLWIVVNFILYQIKNKVRRNNII